MGISAGSLVEITGGWHEHIGRTCIVQSVDNSTAWVQPVDDTDEWFTPQGEPFPINRGLLLELPTPTQLRAGKRKLREQHLAERRALPYKSPEARPGNIRRFKQN